MGRLGEPETITAQGASVTQLVQALSEQQGCTVLDKTGLTGKYDFKLQWMPESQTPMSKAAVGGQAAANTPPPESFGPSLFTALQEQLGLKLASQKGPVESLVIDHVEKPSEN